MSNQIKYHCPVCGDIKYAYPISFIPRCEKCNRYMSEAPDETKLAFGTDNEITKGLECCIFDECENCPHDEETACVENLHQETINLINRKNAEIERLQNTIIALVNYLDILGVDKTDTSLVKEANELNAQIRADVKAEAVNEFAEIFLKKVHDNHYMLSDQINSKDYGMFTIGIEQAVNETKKEMEVEGGEQNESKSHG